MVNGLELKLMVEELPEFKYTFGDPRTILMQYMLTFDNVETFINPNRPPAKSKVHTHECISNESKRALVPPKSTTAFETLLKEGTQPFMIIPLLTLTKASCRSGDTNTYKHMMYVLYNRITNEIERIDIKKYHIQGFKIKTSYKVIQTSLLPAIQEYDQECTFISEHDVTNQVLQTLHTDTSKYAYPPYIISYLQMRFKHPEESSKAIQKRVNRVRKGTFHKNWKKYVEFCQLHETYKCAGGKFHNLESGRCIIKSRKNMAKHGAEIVQRKCNKNEEYDVVQNKCINTKDKVNINIGMKDIMDIKLKKTVMLESVGSVKTALSAMMYIMSKHPDAYFVNPLIHGNQGKANKRQLKKKEISILWAYKQKLDDFKLAIPVGFWEAWEHGMMSPHRFLVAPMSLISRELGKHANVLIYDKTNNELERFDGLGAETSRHYNLVEADTQILAQFKEREGTHVPKDIKYFIPIDYCPRKTSVFQSKELDQIGFDDTRGNCAVWRLWYIDIRLGNYHLTRDKVVLYASKELEKFGNYPRFIKSYQAYVLKGIANMKKSKNKQHVPANNMS